MTTNEQPPFGAAVSSLAIASSGITVPGPATDPVSSVELPSANERKPPRETVAAFCVRILRLHPAFAGMTPRALEKVS
jgi:hypothetical protein